ncbi:MAG: hypothetical protein ABIN18_29355 [Pseudomonadota bacterium]
MGTSNFAERIRLVHLLAKPHKEMPHQKELLRKTDPERLLRKACKLLGGLRDSQERKKAISEEDLKKRILFY